MKRSCEGAVSLEAGIVEDRHLNALYSLAVHVSHHVYFVAS